MSINITFLNKSMQLPKAVLDVKDICLIFNVKEDGLHLKLNDPSNERWINAWPDLNGKINPTEIPGNCIEGLLIAQKEQNSLNSYNSKNEQGTTTITFTNNSGSTFSTTTAG